jgi:hypothetical protein
VWALLFIGNRRGAITRSFSGKKISSFFAKAAIHFGGRQPLRMFHYPVHGAHV